MKTQYKNIRLQPDSLSMITTCDSIIDEYMAAGLRLTLRQLYYQFVARDLFPEDRKWTEINKKWVRDPNGTKNAEPNYKWLSSLLSDGRMAGLIDWSAIEDRGRQPKTPNEFTNLPELIETAIRSYRLPRWEGQEYYAEIWVEKEALAGVIAPTATEFHATLMVNKGYSSQTAMYESAHRFINSGRRPILFYIGDHDPSGEDMVRDIRERLTLFGVEDIEVQKLALNMDQVRHYNPPPNPAKINDPRATAYIREFGNSSWEVDALPPQVLNDLIREAFEGIIDSDLMDTIKRKEEADKRKLRSVTGEKKKKR